MNKQATAGLNEPQTQNWQPRFTVWLHLEISNPSKSMSHLRLLYSSGRVALGKTQVGAYVGLHHLGIPMASTPSGLPTDHVRPPFPCPCTADPPWRAGVGGKCSQPILAADCPGQIPPIYLPTATKAQLHEEGVLSPHEGFTSSTQNG